MSIRRSIATGAFLGALGAAALPACKQETKQETSAEAVDGAGLNEEQQLALKVLTSKLKADRWTFPADEITNTTNQPLFVHLATKSNRPELVGASFHALHETHRKRSSGSLDVAAVDAMKQHLNTKDSRLLGRTLTLAAVAVADKASDPLLVQQLLEVAQKQQTPAARYALLDTLGSVPQERMTAEIAAYFVECLSAKEPYVVSQALYQIERARLSFKDDPSVVAKIKPLLQHADPGVRGRALSALVLLNQSEPSLPSAAVAALSDDAPYVRAEACHALSRIDHERAIHAAMPLLEDKAAALYTIENVPTLEGGTRRLNHRVTDAATVQQAAMAAVDTLAGKALTLPHVPSGPKREAALAAAAKQARDWYIANREQLPKAEPAATADKAPDK